MIGASVVGNPAAVVITSSPGLRRLSPSFLEVSAEIAIRFAEDQEFTAIACLTPI